MVINPVLGLTNCLAPGMVGAIPNKKKKKENDPNALKVNTIGPGRFIS